MDDKELHAVVKSGQKQLTFCILHLIAMSMPFLLRRKTVSINRFFKLIVAVLPDLRRMQLLLKTDICSPQIFPVIADEKW